MLVLFLYFSFLELMAQTVKALQVEVHLCTTGTTNGSVRLWNLRRVGGKGETSDCRFLWIRIGQLENKWN